MAVPMNPWRVPTLTSTLTPTLTSTVTPLLAPTLTLLSSAGYLGLPDKTDEKFLVNPVRCPAANCQRWH